MARQLLTERTTFSGGTVGGTAEAPVIEAVLLCGPISDNRRRYLAKAFEGDRVKRYNGVPVKVTVKHGDDNGLYQEQIGIVQNARHRQDGMPIGDLAINPHKPYAQAFLWDAKNQPKACGMSHVAECDTTTAGDGWVDVQELVEAISVDVIGANGAATTRGLFESNKGRAVAKISLKKFVERFGAKWGATKWAAATKLCEDMGAICDSPVMDEPSPETTDGDFKSALMSALAPLLDEAFESGNSDKAVSALKDFIKLHAKHTGKAEPKDKPADGTATESKKPTLTELIAECKAKGYTDPTGEDLAILADIGSEAGRVSAIERFKKTTEGNGQRPTGTSRRPGAGTAGGTPVKESKAPEKPPALPKFDDI